MQKLSLGEPVDIFSIVALDELVPWGIRETNLGLDTSDLLLAASYVVEERVREYLKEIGRDSGILENGCIISTKVDDPYFLDDRVSGPSIGSRRDITSLTFPSELIGEAEITERTALEGPPPPEEYVLDEALEIYQGNLGAQLSLRFREDESLEQIALTKDNIRARVKSLQEFPFSVDLPIVSLPVQEGFLWDVGSEFYGDFGPFRTSGFDVSFSDLQHSQSQELDEIMLCGLPQHFIRYLGIRLLETLRLSWMRERDSSDILGVCGDSEKSYLELAVAGDQRSFALNWCHEIDPDPGCDGVPPMIYQNVPLAKGFMQGEDQLRILYLGISPGKKFERYSLDWLAFDNLHSVIQDQLSTRLIQ